MVNYKVPLETVDRHLAAHRSFLDKYYASGNLVCSGSRNPRVGGIILCRAESRARVETITKEDPFYINGVADYEIIEFDPVKYAPDFAPFVNRS